MRIYNYWSYILEQMKDSERNSRETGNGCQTIVKIEKGEHGASKFEGILTLDHVI